MASAEGIAPQALAAVLLAEEPDPVDVDELDDDDVSPDDPDDDELVDELAPDELAAEDDPPLEERLSVL